MDARKAFQTLTQLRALVTDAEWKRSQDLFVQIKQKARLQPVKAVNSPTGLAAISLFLSSEERDVDVDAFQKPSGFTAREFKAHVTEIKLALSLSSLNEHGGASVSVAGTPTGRKTRSSTSAASTPTQTPTKSNPKSKPSTSTSASASKSPSKSSLLALAQNGSPTPTKH
ncbi:hypothetical protein BT69DRAFT_1293628, partial [Atractiella rhizophila]